MLIASSIEGALVGPLLLPTADGTSEIRSIMLPLYALTWRHVHLTGIDTMHCQAKTTGPSHLTRIECAAVLTDPLLVRGSLSLHAPHAVMTRRAQHVAYP